MLTRQDVLEKAKEEHVKFLRLQFTDTFGTLKNIAVTNEDIERAMAGKITFDGSVVDGVVNSHEQDVVFRPDTSTFVVFPWRPRNEAVARFICDIENPDGTPYPGCSRSVLKKVLDEANQMGFEVWVGTEVEFYLLNIDDNGNPTTNTHDRAGFCDLTPVDLGENARRDMVLTMEEMGLDIGFSHHEMGPGQHGIALKLDNALSIADKLVTFKFIVRTIAQRHGLYASLMPKPLNGMPGSALYFHILLCRKGSGAHLNEGQALDLNQEIGSFINGILTHTRANTAITNPLINSYKRLVPDERTPIYIAWSEESRNSVIRIIAHDGPGAMLEVRNPDPACNPYLALAVILKAGLNGIRQQLPLPVPLCQNTSQILEPESTKLGMARLPSTLEEALRELASDPLARATMGEYIYQIFTKTKAKEWERFQSHVHPWELEEYLSTY